MHSFVHICKQVQMKYAISSFDPWAANVCSYSRNLQTDRHTDTQYDYHTFAPTLHGEVNIHQLFYTQVCIMLITLWIENQIIENINWYQLYLPKLSDKKIIIQKTKLSMTRILMNFLASENHQCSLYMVIKYIIIKKSYIFVIHRSEYR